MSELIACYKSGHRLVIEAWDAYGEERKRFSDDVFALTADLWPEKVDGTKVEPIVASSSWDPGKRTLIGWSWPYGVKAPEGWKATDDRSAGRIVTPKRSSKEGKALAKRIDALRPVAGLSLPGMPLQLLALPASYSPAIERHGDVLYAGWGVDIEAHEPRATPGGKPIDFDLWTRIKVSEFFAAREDDPTYVAPTEGAA